METGAGGRHVDLAEGLQQVIDAGAPAQIAQAQEFRHLIEGHDLAGEEPVVQAARDLVRAFLHDPDLWR